MSVYLNYKYLVTNRLPVTVANVTGNFAVRLCVGSQFYKRLSFVLLVEVLSILISFRLLYYLSWENLYLFESIALIFYFLRRYKIFSNNFSF